MPPRPSTAHQTLGSAFYDVVAPARFPALTLRYSNQRAAALPRVLRLPSLLIVVSDSNLASARDVGRLRRMLGPNSAERSTLHILNKSGAPGALSTDEFARGSGQAAD